MDPTTIISATIGAVATVIAAVIGVAFSRNKARNQSKNKPADVGSENLNWDLTEPIDTNYETEIAMYSHPSNELKAPFIDVELKKDEAEKISHYRNIAVSKIESLRYTAEVIRSFSTAYSELVNNAFEHGWRNNRDTIKITIDVNSSFIALTVINLGGRKFDIQEIMERNRKKIHEDPHTRRGRGLLVVAELSDTFENLADQRSVKAVFFADRVVFNIQVQEEKGLTILEVLEGLYNPSFQRRLTVTAKKLLQNHLILDFQRWVTSTVAHFVIIELNELYSLSGKRIVALIAPDSGDQGSEAILPDAVIAYTWEEALRKIFDSQSDDQSPAPEHIRMAEELRKFKEESNREDDK